MHAVGDALIQQLGFQRIQRGRHVLVALAPRHQRQIAADALQFLFQQINAPAVIGNGLHVQAGKDGGHVLRDDFVIDGGAGSGVQMALLRPHVIGCAITL